MNSRLFTSPGGSPSCGSSTTVNACIVVTEVHRLDDVLVLEGQLFLSTGGERHLKLLQHYTRVGGPSRIVSSKKK